jgi:tripartite-type tricarboxylate transporter receptor subunit TctC
MRSALRIVLLLLVFPLGGALHAQPYPSKPIRMITFNSAGGPPDLLYRLMAEGITGALGQPVVVENRPGAGGIIAVDALAKSPNDGYTIGMGGSGPHTVAPNLGQVKYDPVKDFSPITTTFLVTFRLTVVSSLNINTAQELVAYARANPGKLNYGVTGTGTTPHLGMELFKLRNGNLNIVLVTYKGDADTVLALGNGDIQIMLSATSASQALVQQGRVKLLAQSGATRDPEYAGLPTFREAGVGDFSVAGWGSLVAPAGVPRDIIQRLNAAVLAQMAKPDVAAKAAGTRLGPKFGSPEELAALTVTDLALWKETIEKANIRVQ